jgi:hypothetical protein
MRLRYVALLIGMLISDGATARQQPLLPIGAKYSLVRKAMIEAGYGSYREAPRGASDMYVNEQFKGDIRAAFPELVHCSGTGSNYCTFIFKRGSSDLVEIVTKGEVPALLEVVSMTAVDPRDAADEYQQAYAADD